MKIVKPIQINDSWLAASNVAETDFASTSTVSITIAPPGVITWLGHGLLLNQPLSFSTTGALPTGLVAATIYYVRSTPTIDTFTVSTAPGGGAITTTGTQSGVHTAAVQSTWASTTTYQLGARVRLALTASIVGSFLNLPLPVQPASTGTFTRTDAGSNLLYVGMELSGPGIPRGMIVTAQQTGTTGLAGLYAVSLQRNISSCAIVGSLHKAYESLQAANIGHFPVGTTSLATDTWWVSLGSTNCWRMFDQSVASQTTNVGTIDCQLNVAGIVDTIVLLNIDAATARFTMTDIVDGVVYDQTYNLTSNGGIMDFYSWYFTPISRARDFLELDMPKYNNPTLTITLTGTGNVVTISNAAPAVVSQIAHGNVAGTPVSFTTTGTLPTGLTAETTYYVIAAGLTANAYEISATPNGAAINTSTSPFTPTVVGTATGLSAPRGVYVSGTHAYVTNYGGNTMSVIDISNPTAPVIVGTATGLSAPIGVYVSGTHAYVTNFGGTTMSVIDISNPTAPVIVGTATGLSAPGGVYVSGTHAYVPNYGGNTMSVIDISNPTAPVIVGTTTGLSAPIEVYVSGTHAYVTNFGGTTMSVIDISNPAGDGVNTAHTETVACGACIVGLRRTIGATQYGMGLGIQDYSVKQRDAFGNFSILERAYNNRVTMAVWVENAFVDELLALLASYRATPVVYIGSDGFTSSAVYGFYKTFDTLVSYTNNSICNLELEGIA